MSERVPRPRNRVAPGPVLPDGGLSVAAFLELDAVRFAGPTILAGSAGQSRTITWVHVSEIADISNYLSGGELILTTGILLPETPRGLATYIKDLNTAGASGLVLGLGRRFSLRDVPKTMLDAAERLRFPVMALGRETPFVRITTEVHRTIISAQNEAMRKAEEASRALVELSIDGAGPAEILKQIAVRAHCPVLLESTAHQLLSYDTAGFDLGYIIDDWERNTRKVVAADRVGFDPGTRWLIGRIGARGHDWGRLILMTDVEGSDATRALVERAVSGLAVHRLLAVDHEPMDRLAQRDILRDIRTHAASPADLSLRMRALGVAVQDRRLLGVVVRPAVRSSASPAAHRQQRAELVDALEQAALVARVTSVVGDLGAAGVQAVIAMPVDRSESAMLDQLTSALRAVTSNVVIGIGEGATELGGVAQSLVAAEHALASAPSSDSSRAYFRASDARVRGLFYSMREDTRLQAFVEHELGPLLAFDAKRDTELVDTLRVYLANGRNKSAAAEASHMSRPAFYQRLLRIGRVLGVDLDSVDDCLSLHIAMLAHEVLHG